MTLTKASIAGRLRNTDHLEIQAKKDWYAASSKSKTVYTAAVTAGKGYVAG